MSVDINDYIDVSLDDIQKQVHEIATLADRIQDSYHINPSYLEELQRRMEEI